VALMRAMIAGVLASLLGSGAAQSAERVITADARLEKLYAATWHTEGPAVGPDGRIYFCDITATSRTNMEAGEILVFDPASGRTSVYRSPSAMAAGIKFDSRGDMIVTEGADFGGRAVVRTDRPSGRSFILAALFEGRPLNAPNDLDIDSAGRIYFTDPRYFGHEPLEQPVFGVYRIDPDGSIARLAADVTMPNGIALSPDEKTLYVVETNIGTTDVSRPDVTTRFGPMRILAYDLSTRGSLSNRRIFVDFGSELGADGIAVDRDSNVYAAVQSARIAGVHVYSPAGKEIAYIPTPETAYNLALVKNGSGTFMYITAGKSLYRIRTQIPPPAR
jgi:gluconolactonase